MCSKHFNFQIGDKVKSTMSSSLISSYGVNYESKTNRDITDAWDKAQERVRIILILYV